MRLSVLIGLFSIVISSCNTNSETRQDEEKVDKEILIGTIEGDIYKNDFFNFQIKFDDNWEVNQGPCKDQFGELFYAVTPSKLPDAAPLKIVMRFHNVNPDHLMEEPSSRTMLEHSREAMEAVKKGDVIMKPIVKYKIAGEYYDYSMLMVVDAGDTTYFKEYCRYVDGYYISLDCTYSSKKDELEAKGLISQIKKNPEMI